MSDYQAVEHDDRCRRALPPADCPCNKHDDSCRRARPVAACPCKEF